MDESDDNCCILPLLLGATKAPAVEARRERRRHFIVALLSCLLGSERPYGALKVIVVGSRSDSVLVFESFGWTRVSNNTGRPYLRQ